MIASLTLNHKRRLIMRNTIKIFLALMILTFIISCQNKKENQTTSNPSSEKTIAIITPSAEHGWLAGVTYYAEQRAKELGLSYKIYQSQNVNDQANDIADAIAAKSSVIIMFPHNDEVSVSAKQITDANIPLVVFDRKIDVNYTGYLAGNNADMGTASAKEIGTYLKGTGTVAIENVPSSGSVSTERVNAFKEEMKKSFPNIKLVDFTVDGFSQEQGLAAGSDMLTANPKLDAVFSIDDESSLGFLQAITEAKRTDIKIMSGGGGSQSYFAKIKDSKDIKLFTATYSPMMMKDVVDLAKELIDGKTIQKDTIKPTIIVNSENVTKFIDANSPY